MRALGERDRCGLFVVVVLSVSALPDLGGRTNEPTNEGRQQHCCRLFHNSNSQQLRGKKSSGRHDGAAAAVVGADDDDDGHPGHGGHVLTDDEPGKGRISAVQASAQAP